MFTHKPTFFNSCILPVCILTILTHFSHWLCFYLPPPPPSPFCHFVLMVQSQLKRKSSASERLIRSARAKSLPGNLDLPIDTPPKDQPHPSPNERLQSPSYPTPIDNQAIHPIHQTHTESIQKQPHISASENQAIQQLHPHPQWKAKEPSIPRPQWRASNAAIPRHTTTPALHLPKQTPVPTIPPHPRFIPHWLPPAPHERW